MKLRDVGFFLRGRINSGLTRVLNRRRRGGQPLAPVPLEEALAAGESLLALVGVLEGRSNPERQEAVARYLETRGIPFTRHRFASFEGAGENYVVELGEGNQVLVLIAHHDAVLGSPGANDNAAAVAILFRLIDRLRHRPPRGLRVRCLFPAAEELGYLGTRAYVRDSVLSEIIGVLSLELCGIGDSLAIWDAGEETPFLGRVRVALEGRGLRADETYHVVGRIPVFGSDHRAFAQTGLPAYGLTVVPVGEADGLRRFVFSPVRSALLHAIRRPPPFDTYHTSRDAGETLDPAAMELVLEGLDAVVAELAR